MRLLTVRPSQRARDQVRGKLRLREVGGFKARFSLKHFARFRITISYALFKYLGWVLLLDVTRG